MNIFGDSISYAGGAVGTAIGGPGGTAIGALAGSWLGDSLTSFLGDVGGNFSAVFANGFDLSCWGSSNSPSYAKETTPKDMNDLLDFSGIGSAVNSATYTKFIKYVDFYIARKMESATNSSNASCTRKGNQTAADMAGLFKSELESQVKAQFNVSVLSSGMEGNWSWHIKWRNDSLTMSKQIPVKVYQLTPKSATGSSPSGDEYSPSGSKEPKQSGLGVLGWGVLGSIIANMLSKN